MLENKIDNKNVVDFLGIRVNNLYSYEILNHVEKCIKRRKPCHVVGLNVDQALKVIENDYSHQIFDSAEIVFTDGKPIIWMSKYLKQPIKERIAGPDLMDLLCEQAAKNGHKIFILGCAEGVAAKAAEVLKNKYKGLECVGTYSPPYGFEKKQDEINKINLILKESGADELFVGMGSPKQDIFIYENMNKYDIPVSFSMGAAIDFIGGNIKRAPRWMSSIGLEWLHRMLQDPKRLVKRYLIDDIKIIKYLFKYQK